MFKRNLIPACVGLALLAPTVRAQDVGKDVPPSHWAYSAVQDLAGKGLIKGYPPDNQFLGGRTLTRYEMATIIERVIQHMDEVLGQKADKADLAKLQTNIGEIRDIIDEFRKELTVIGTDMTQVKADLEALRGQVNALTTRVNGLDRRVTDVQTLADQALENINELKTATNAALAKKVDVGVGKVRVSGLFQVWGVTPFGDASSSGTGRSYGGGVGDTARLRRGEIALVGSINSKVDYRAMFDITKIAGVTTTPTSVTIPGVNGGKPFNVVTGVASNAPSNVLQDLWIGYSFAPRFRLEVGQQKTGLSEEGTRTSSQLLTVERSIMNGLPANTGRVGDIRDTGAVVRFSNSVGNIMLGVFNGNGEVQNTVDNNRAKFAMANAYFTGIRHLTIGAWGGGNFGDSRPSVGKDRLGATVILNYGPHFFEGEGAFTRDYAAGAVPGSGAGTSGRGGYLLYGYTVNKKFQVVGRYDIWDPAYQAGQSAASATTIDNGIVIPKGEHRLMEYTAGVNYYLQGHNAKIQLNYIWEDPQKNGVAFFGPRRRVGIVNFQTAF